jgi:hypothetical protein
MQFVKEIFKKTDRKQNIEFGQVFVLVCIVLTIYLKNYHIAVYAFWGLLLTILIPMVFYPFAVLWFGISGILSRVSSFLLLNAIFFIFVVPVGQFRKLLGKDTLKLKQFKRNRHSVMTERNHVYVAADLKNTF